MIRAVALALALACAGCAAGDHAVTQYEARPFDEDRDAMAAVDAALAEAAATNRNVLLVMGADWCHDSRALAGMFGSERFAALMATDFVPVYIDAGRPREDAAANVDVARRFGVDRLIGTPNLFVLSADGRLLNDPEDVTRWTDAASRDADEVEAFLKAHRPAGR